MIIEIFLGLFLSFAMIMISSYIKYWLFYRHWIQADIYDKTIKLKKDEI